MSSGIKGSESEPPLPSDGQTTHDAAAISAAIAAGRKTLSMLSGSERVAVLCALASEIGLRLTRQPPQGVIGPEEACPPGSAGWSEAFEAQVGLSDTLLDAALRLDRAVEHKSRRLKASEARYELFFERVKEGVFACDRLGRFLEVNPAVLELTGYRSKEALMTERTFSRLFADPGSWKAFSAQLRARQCVHDAECELMRRDGSRVHVLVTAILVHGSDGRAVGFEGIWRDMTEQRRLEERMTEAERLEAVNRMVLTCSHEMNQPLTVLSDYSQRLLERCEAEGSDPEAARVMSEQAMKLAGVIAKLGQIREPRNKPSVKGIGMLGLDASTRSDHPTS